MTIAAKHPLSILFIDIHIIADISINSYFSFPLSSTTLVWCFLSLYILVVVFCTPALVIFCLTWNPLHVQLPRITLPIVELSPVHNRHCYDLVGLNMVWHRYTLQWETISQPVNLIISLPQ